MRGAPAAAAPAAFCAVCGLVSGPAQGGEGGGGRGALARSNSREKHKARPKTPSDSRRIVWAEAERRGDVIRNKQKMR